jgi:cytochrome P450
VGITSRVATVTDVVNGIKIPEHTIIFIPIFAVNHDEKVWGPDVDEFKPDRWEKPPENYNDLTFLQGPRSCIGRRFAETEMKVLLVALIQKFRFDEVVKGRHVERKVVITTKPKNGLYLRISAV